MMKKIQTGDSVIVIAGKHKGAKSVVSKVEGELVYLTGVNVVKRATKKQGYVTKELPLHCSNVSLFDQSANRPSRVRIDDVGGKKVRVYKRSGEVVKKAA